MATSIKDDPKPGYLEGKLLVATPQITGSCFDKSVIYVCVHNDNGAMGVIINQKVDNVGFSDLLQHLKIDSPQIHAPMPIHFGGPIEATRGFILHSSDYESGEQLVKHDGIALTSSVDMLKDIAAGNGPRDGMLVLGYAGWAPGQLEAEIEANGWITIAATPELIFNRDNDGKWQQAIHSLGFEAHRLSTTAGHA